MVHLVFVYGTLKTGEPNYRLMKDDTSGLCELRGVAYTKDKFPLVVASRYDVPYLLYEPGIGHQVEGELYEVDDAQLERLDKLENHPNLYIRRDVTLTTKRGENEAGEEIEAQAYFLVKFRQELLELPMVDSYKDLVNKKKYVLHKDRDVQAPSWYYEVHTEYEKK